MEHDLRSVKDKSQYIFNNTIHAQEHGLSKCRSKPTIDPEPIPLLLMETVVEFFTGFCP